MFRGKALRKALAVTQRSSGTLMRPIPYPKRLRDNADTSSQFSTKVPPPPQDDYEALRMISDPNCEHVRDVYVSESGEEVFSVDAGAVLESTFDWSEFERRFGLDNISDEGIDDGWEDLQKKYQVTSKEITAKRERAKPSVIVPARESLNVEKSFADKGFSLEYATADDLQVAEDAAAKPTRFDNPNAFQQPVNVKRPGYERRVMSMEREMEKIAVDVLCKEDSEWYTEGADVERVLLSPNMKNLTVYYSLEHGASPRPAWWWRKTHSKFEAVVRSALAERLETKYVPRVYLQRAKTTDDSKSKADGVNELDLLFDQIAVERAETSRTE